jgi:hypothetical protein
LLVGHVMTNAMYEIIQFTAEGRPGSATVHVRGYRAAMAYLLMIATDAAYRGSSIVVMPGGEDILLDIKEHDGRCWLVASMWRARPKGVDKPE